MKKLYLIFSTLCLVFLVGCGNDDNTPNEEKIIGKWEAYLLIEYDGSEIPDYKETKEFKPNGILITTILQNTTTVTYTIKDDIIETKIEGMPSITYKIIQLDKQNLKLEYNHGMKIYYKRIK